MANTSANTTYDINTNYIGELIRIGAGRTPFLTAIGGIGGANAKTAKDWSFPLNAQYSLEGASQPAITETDSLTAGTPTNYDKAQDLNYCQIFQEPVVVSYAAQSAISKLSGLALTGVPVEEQDPLAFQIKANLEQVALDMDYTFLRGTFAAPTNAATATKTRGLIEACASGAVNAGGDALTTADIDALLLDMVGHHAPLKDPTIICTAATKQRLTTLYGNAALVSPDTKVGGQAIDTINTDFCRLKVMYEPQMVAGTLLIADMAYISPVFLPVPGKGVLFYEELAKVGAGSKGQIYCQAGLGYTAEEYHGKITNFI
jgi:hypothetical protein